MHVWNKLYDKQNKYRHTCRRSLFRTLLPMKVKLPRSLPSKSLSERSIINVFALILLSENENTHAVHSYNIGASMGYV